MLMGLRQVFGTRCGLRLMKEAGRDVRRMVALAKDHMSHERAVTFFPAVQQLVLDPTTWPLFRELMRRGSETGQAGPDLETLFWEPSNRDLRDRVLADVPSNLAAEDEWDKLALALTGTDGPGLRVRAAMEDPRVLTELFRILWLSPVLVGMCGRVLRGEEPQASLLRDPRLSAWHFAAWHLERQ
jgi:hypothetical protein